MLNALFGKPEAREKALCNLSPKLDERDQEFMRRGLNAKFFALAPAGQNYSNSLLLSCTSFLVRSSS